MPQKNLFAVPGVMREVRITVRYLWEKGPDEYEIEVHVGVSKGPDVHVGPLAWPERAEGYLPEACSRVVRAFLDGEDAAYVASTTQATLGSAAFSVH